MQFSWNGSPYVIEFARRFRETPKARYPYTKATILKVDSPQVTTPVRTWEVGCYYKDTFTHEQGRKAALRGALYDDPRAPNHPSALPKEFKAAAWDSYFKRWKDGQKRVSKRGRVID